MGEEFSFERLEQRSRELKYHTCAPQLPAKASLWARLLSGCSIDALPAGVAVLDNNFVLRQQNRTYADYVRVYSPYGPEKAVGMCYFDYIPGSQAQLEALFREARDWVRSETLHDFCLRIACEVEDRESYWDATLSPVRGQAGSVEGILIFCIDVTERHQARQALGRKQEELGDLKDALRALWGLREEDRKELKNQLAGQAREMVLPFVYRLKTSRLDAEQQTCLEIIEANLKEFLSSFSRRLSSRASGLTPKEIEVAHFIRAGKTSKEIAELMRVSPACIDFHRNNIRKKLGLTSKKTSLRSYLLESFPP